MGSYSLGGQLAGVLRTSRASSALQDTVAQLFEETRDDVYRYLLTLGLHPPQAQEAAQEVFLRLYTTMRKGVEIENPRAWIFRVAHNFGLKVRARPEAHPRYDPGISGEIVSQQPDIESALIERERMRRFHRAVEALSEQQKRCLFLRLEGLRYAEIAAALGISASAVGEFLRRAVSRLRKASHE
jgi:RNA polymerase sigma-70 factor (ECF subfamily)